MEEEYVIWWDSPCKGMINVLKYFVEDFSPESVVITGDTGNYRKSMGWCDVKQCFKNHIIISDVNWESDTIRLFEKYHDRIHVFNGITRRYFIHLLKRCVAENVRFAIMTEAYSNLEFGFNRMIKNLYLNYYLPIKVRPYAKKSLGVFCLSGRKEKDLIQLQKLGFPKERIVPFGYWTEPPEYMYKRTDDKIHIICPGVLKPYKGVDVLINAISIINKTKSNIPKFIVHITGNGVEKEKLINLSNSMGLQKYIIFHGSLNENDYQNLLTNIDILVAPGYVEPWGIRINEAIQRGQIIISSDGLGASYLIEESLGGFVFKSGDSNGLATILDTVLKMSIDEMEILKKNNLKYAHKISCKIKAKELFGELSRLSKL